MKTYSIWIRALLLCCAISLPIGGEAFAQKRYDPGATDTEITIGQTMPYSGPASSYGTIGRAEAAYFAKINAEGGVNGRKIKLISLDDGFNPAKTVEQIRRLVERDGVLLIFNPQGSPTNAAIQKYLNQRKVPQLFVGAGDAKFGDPKRYPWTMGFHQTNYTEGKVYAAYILKHFSRAKIGVLYLNDDFGKELLKGLRDGLGGRAKELVVGAAEMRCGSIANPCPPSVLIVHGAWSVPLERPNSKLRWRAVASSALVGIGNGIIFFLPST